MRQIGGWYHMDGSRSGRCDMAESALIVGAGSGLSAALARLLAKAGMRVALAARRTDKLAALAAETGASTHRCDASEPRDVEALFTAVTAASGTPDLVIYNPSYRARGPFIELDQQEVLKALVVTAYGGFLVAQAAVRPMLARGSGTLLFTGA